MKDISSRRAAFFSTQTPTPAECAKKRLKPARRECERKYWLREVDRRRQSWRGGGGWRSKGWQRTSTRGQSRRKKWEKTWESALWLLNRRCPFYSGSNRTVPSSPRCVSAPRFWILNFILFVSLLRTCDEIEGSLWNPCSEVRGRPSPPLPPSHPSLSPSVVVCLRSREQKELLVCFLPPHFPHFAPICFTLAVRSHLCHLWECQLWFLLCVWFFLFVFWVHV